MSSTTPRSKWPERLVEFVNIVFGVVIAESLARYSAHIVHPRLSLALVGLGGVQLVTILSWVFYHRSMERYRYKREFLGLVRFFVDFVIVGAYAYLLYSLESIVEHRRLSGYLAGFPAIFAFYIFGGRIRQWEHPGVPGASRQPLLVLFFAFLLSLHLVYKYLVPVGLRDRGAILWLFLLLPPILCVIYRYLRWRLYENSG